MRLTQGEIRSNAIRFAAEWKDAAVERAEAQSFWTELFAVYGIKRRSVASFEEKVRNLSGAFDRIDVFYAGVMLGEHKSRGEDLTKAQSQAFNYVQSLTREARHSEVPQYIVLSDFETIVVFDLDASDPAEPVARFPTAKLHENTRHLGFLAGQTTRPIDPEDPINIDAVEILGRLHDALESRGYTGHALERFLVRVLFCLFADDTGILEPDTFKAIIKESREDGFGLGALLNQVFDILDTPKDQRAQLPEEFANLPYVNGQLFAERLPAVNFNAETRAALLEACEFNWSRISPAVFGSLFQSIMAGDEGAKKRRQIGAHYTSERDIMKLIRSLFLDDLEAELAKITTKPKLLEFQDKLASLKMLDPACGCGNFLVVAYRELRRLEIEVLEKFHAKKKGEIQQILNLDALLKVNVDQMHGIEIEEWPARIAEVAMWLVDHQMNTKAGEIFGQPVLRLPLTKSAKIVHANALRTDWNEVLPAAECSFVLGNPPFVGKKATSADQKADIATIWAGVKGSGVLDYVTCWYRRAASYIEEYDIVVGFVSTNSITQGEQPSVMWPPLFQERVRIRFAHRTFCWMSEARGAAHVHVVIIGFAKSDSDTKIIIDYTDEAHPVTIRANNINPYLIDAPDVVVTSRTGPLSAVPQIVFGSMPNEAKLSKAEAIRRFGAQDAENYLADQLLLSDADRSVLIAQEPESSEWIKPFVGADEFIAGEKRWCLWMVDIPPSTLRRLQKVRERVERIKVNRELSNREATKALAKTPWLFGEIRQPRTDYLLIPRHSSERREYIPIGFLPQEVIAGDSCLVIEGASHFHFGVLTSSMHMAWVRTVCGRIKSDFRYSNKLVYNNFPWPESPTDAQKAAVEQAAQGVLDARAQFPDQTLADLYDPLAMPKPLRDAHRALDRAVDRCYRKNPFDSERARVEFLFDLYQKLTTPLTAPTRSKSRPASKTKKPRTKRT
jgi:hypothetical protein